ncbi:fibronectin type III domain-containing protein [Cellulosimicrobium cellulans]|uniref:fibronectin type III domain-containing protein n=1 Tax=Cellulosimicrobium cellulans TaxID=1710 RepID=UPI001BA62F76|nr:fibronectin type III domain-containing protein [Cellulosimicrobium cellulans]QUC01097.1 fibronectin type III domain-containing protein [Cellulosimicrobium cellulans]
MAISWGPDESASGSRLRVGIEVVYSNPGTGTSCTMTRRYYVNTDSGHYSDNQTLNTSTGSYNYRLELSDTTKLVATWTGTVPVRYASQGSYTDSTSATVSGAYNGVTPSHAITTTRPARAASAPNGVSSGPSISNLSTTSATVSWGASTNGNGATVNGYQLQVLQGSTVVYDNTATSLSRNVTVLSPGVTYSARVRARNSAGLFSGWSSTSFTTVSGMKVRVGGVWRNAKVWVRLGGTWRQAKVYVRNGGTWKAAK